MENGSCLGYASFSFKQGTPCGHPAIRVLLGFWWSRKQSQQPKGNRLPPGEREWASMMSSPERQGRRQTEIHTPRERPWHALAQFHHAAKNKQTTTGLKLQVDQGCAVFIHPLTLEHQAICTRPLPSVLWTENKPCARAESRNSKLTLCARANILKGTWQKKTCKQIASEIRAKFDCVDFRNQNIK